MTGTGAVARGSPPQTYTVYRLPLPSGGVILARKLDRTALVAQGLLLFPLLAAAYSATQSEDDPVPDRLKHVRDICRAAVVQELDIDDLTLADRMKIYQWAFTADPGDAVEECVRPWVSHDFEPLITGHGAILLDALCSRYMIRPSACAGIVEPALAVDLDLAVAFRGLRHEHGPREVEVEDITGKTHRVPVDDIEPFSMHSQTPRIIHADHYARRAAKLGLSVLSVSAGGLAGDGLIGPQDRFRMQ